MTIAFAKKGGLLKMWDSFAFYVCLSGSVSRRVGSFLGSFGVNQGHGKLSLEQKVQRKNSLEN